MRSQAGQSTIEFVAVVLLVSSLLAVTGTTGVAPLSNAIARGIQRAYCTVLHQRCSTLDPNPCTIRTDSQKLSLSVKFTVVSVGRNGAIIRSESSDGTISITLLDKVNAGLEAAIGAKGEIKLGGQSIGASASAQAHVIAQLGGGRTWQVHSADEADALIGKIRRAVLMRGLGSEKLVNLGRRLLHKGPQLPPADSTTYTGEVTADVQGLVGPLAGVKAEVGALAGWTTSKEGSRTMMLQLSGNVSAQLSEALGLKAGGKVGVAYTTDKQGHPTKLALTASGTLGFARGVPKEILTTKRGKSVSSAVTATLDLTDPSDAARVDALLSALKDISPSAAIRAAGDLASAIADHAAIDVSTYQEDESTYGADLQAALGLEVGLDAEYTTNASKLQGAWSRPPHGVWEARLDCRA